MPSFLQIRIEEKVVEVFDLSLTPENAQSRGYKYIEDIIYNILVPAEVKKDILRLIYENGFKLGHPTQLHKPYYGLYAPLNKKL